ncbi:MAG TPA: SGNH/GDSL hydrolase family protein [Sphingomonas sp.]|nr:SGNH/GDSL hydrolase family protein [Sphingomonas sp.]
MPGMRGFSRTAIALALLTSLAGAAPPLPVHVGGRAIRYSDGSLGFGWPATYFEGAFEGTGVSVAVETTTDWMQLSVDGTRRVLLTQPGAASMTLSGLLPGAHIVRLEKLTESQSGGGRFIGFYPVDGGRPLPAPSHPRRIEFIGDSHSVGYGDLSPTRDCSTQEVHDRTDSQQAFGPLLARHFDADYRVIAFSGFGVVRNYAGMDSGLSLPIIYRRMKPDEPARLEQDGESWRPQLIVINLGTNDFSTPLHAGERWPDDARLRADYRATYVAFVRGLIAKQPQARLILIGYPSFQAEVSQVAAILNRDARRPVLTFVSGNLELTGCHFHPSLNDHRAMAAGLQDLLDRHSEVWSAR